jgi:DNA-binding transcriptional LysR family regulator
MELRHLRYFVAIAEERSFTRAAERLWIAQPGLSTQIRRLETELGIQLLHRHRRGVDVTEAGRIFLERARITLAAAEHARATRRDLEAGVVGTLRLGIATGARWRLAGELLGAFGLDHPKVEVTVVESHGGTLLRELRDGRLDAVIAASRFGSADLRGIALGSEPWVVLVGRGHRLARPGPVGAAELNGEPLVVTGHRDGAGYDREVVETVTGLGLSPVLQRGGPGPALFAAVVAGAALALTTSATADRSDVVARPLRPVRAVHFELFRRDEPPSPAVSALQRVAEAIVAPPDTASEPTLAAVA